MTLRVASSSASCSGGFQLQYFGVLVHVLKLQAKPLRLGGGDDATAAASIGVLDV